MSVLIDIMSILFRVTTFCKWLSADDKFPASKERVKLNGSEILSFLELKSYMH